MNENKFNAIPADACRFAGGEVAIGDNGEGAKSAPVKIVARSGQPIDHWYWGRVVHDLTGMHRHKPRLTIDYAHNDDEVLGYLNHFDTEGGNLVASGALTPWREDDRASEVLFKMQQGVPYEASIFFGGDGIKLEPVDEGMVAQVNGYDFEGPGIIVREWPLRGVAICPYGADQHTESAAMNSGETFAAQIVEKEIVMSEQQAVEAEVADEAQAVEALTVEAEAAQEQEATELQEPEAPVESAEAAPAEGELSEPADLTTAIGSVQEALQAAETARDELAERVAALEAERDEALSKLKAIEAGAPPVSATPAPEEELTPWKKAQKSGPKR